MIKHYIFLLVAIVFEVSGTLLLPTSQNFSKILPTITLVVFYIFSFYLLTLAIDKIPLTIVYASWSGLGIFTIASFNYFFRQETLTWQAIIGLFFIIIGVTLINGFKEY